MLEITLVDMGKTIQYLTITKTTKWKSFAYFFRWTACFIWNNHMSVVMNNNFTLTSHNSLKHSLAGLPIPLPSGQGQTTSM